MFNGLRLGWMTGTQIISRHGDKRSKYMTRYFLLPKETLKLQPTAQGLHIRVCAGVAWLSHNGKDMILKAGTVTAFDGKGDMVLISAQTPSLIVEIR